jgi:hypothetical protein
MALHWAAPSQLLPRADGGCRAGAAAGIGFSGSIRPPKMLAVWLFGEVQPASSINPARPAINARPHPGRLQHASDVDTVRLQ